MRTLSARILVGFAALTITFGAITATVVVNMRRVEKEIQLVRKGYVPLALVSKDLARRQEDLRATLDEGLRADELTVRDARITLSQLRVRRDSSLSIIRKNVESLDRDGELNAQSFSELPQEVEALQASVDALKPLYDRMLRAAPEANETLDSPRIAEALDQLRAGERSVSSLANGFANEHEAKVRRTTISLEENEQHLFVVTIYFMVISMILGVLITTWVVITLRPLRKLRDAARKVASGDYASPIPERGPAEVRDLARELNTMAHAVEEREKQLIHSERLAAISKIAQDITHEVRNPLTAIALKTEEIMDVLTDLGSDEGRDACRAIHREIDRLTAITEEYLAFGRLPKPKLAYEAVNPMVGALASFVREDLAKKHVELAVDLASGDPIALIDQAQIRQCLINLVRNASDAITGTGKKGVVTLRTRRDGDCVVIEVEDDGVGIRAEHLPKLFDPFFSTKEGGNGLGLALTQQIVKDHGGELAVDSVVGRGTTFKLSVPAGR